MFDTTRSSKCTKMGQSPRSVALLAMAFLASVALPSVVMVPSVEAKKSVKSKKLSKSQKAKRLKKAQQAKKARKARAIRKANRLRAVSGLAGSQRAYKTRLNQNTVTLMSGCCTTGAYTAFGADIKDMIKKANDKNDLRVLPILGGGAGENVRDILYLRGIDMAILNTDVIDYFKGKPLYENLTKRIYYITKLFNEEVHLYAGNSITSLHDLEGKVIGYNNSNAEVTGAILFKKLGITLKKTMRVSEGDGALALKEGRLDAMMRVTGKPIRNVGRMKDIFPQIRLLPIVYDPAFIGSHLPTQLTHEDYPGLIGKGQVVPTIATRTILAVFNWKPRTDRYRRLSKFTETFFDHFTELRRSKNLHPKWTEVNLQATVPGMVRFGPAQKWIDAKTKMVKRQNARPAVGQSNVLNEEMMKNFKQFMVSRAAQGDVNGNSSEPEKLFGDFLLWQKQQR